MILVIQMGWKELELERVGEETVEKVECTF
jgi:hypothetical protein